MWFERTTWKISFQAIKIDCQNLVQCVVHCICITCTLSSVAAITLTSNSCITLQLFTPPSLPPHKVPTSTCQTLPTRQWCTIASWATTISRSSSPMITSLSTWSTSSRSRPSQTRSLVSGRVGPAVWLVSGWLVLVSGRVCTSAN